MGLLLGMLPVMLQLREHGKMLGLELREELKLLVQHMMLLLLLAPLKLLGLMNTQSQGQCQH